MLRRLAPALLSLLVIGVGLGTLAIRPASGPPQRTADYVVLVGVPGLRWADVSAEDTPTLWRMAQLGSIGSLSVRSARAPTCPVDGWLTLGAGNYAAWDDQPVTGQCPTTDVPVERPDGIGANLPDQSAVVLHNREQRPWGTVPGALAESVRCTVAVGPGAAVAAARPFGRVDRYVPELPRDPAPLLRSCVLSIVDLGSVAGDDLAARREQARRVDAELARVLAARPARSLVLLAGVSDTGDESNLHVAVASGRGWRGGWLTSAGTGRDGYVQLVDLAPTVLTAAGREVPERLLRGQPITVVPGRPADLAAAIAQPADADREARAQRRVAAWFFGLLTGCQLLLALAVLPLLPRLRRAGRGGPLGARPLALVEPLLVAAALAIPAALLADAVPWWRADRPGLYYGLSIVALLAVGTLAVRLSPVFRWRLGPMAVVAALAAVVVGVDVITGARLQLNGVVGYSALEGGRYAGMGVIGLGVFSAGALLAAGCLAQRAPRAWRPLVVVLIGGLGVAVVGSPYLGADPVGAVALTAGVSVAGAISTGGWPTASRLTWAALSSITVTLGFALIDLGRPPAERSELGRFLDAMADGTSGVAVRRAGLANLDALVSSPLTVLAAAGAALAWLVLLRPWGGLRRLFGIYPAVRAAMAGILAAALIGGLLGGSALNVAGAATALTLPLALLSAIRVLRHAADRTVGRGPGTPVATDPSPPAGPAAGPGGSPEPAGADQARPGAETAVRLVGYPSPSGEVLPWNPVDRVIIA